MDVKLCVFCIFFVTSVTAGSTNLDQLTSNLGNSEKRSAGSNYILRELITCLTERQVMMEILNVIGTLRDVVDLGGIVDSQAVRDILGLLFAEADVLAETMDSDGISSTESTTGGTTYSAHSTAQSSTSETTYPSTSGTSGPTTSETTEASTSEATTEPEKRFAQLQKDLLRELLLKKLKGN